MKIKFIIIFILTTFSVSGQFNISPFGITILPINSSKSYILNQFSQYAQINIKDCKYFPLLISTSLGQRPYYLNKKNDQSTIIFGNLRLGLKINTNPYCNLFEFWPIAVTHYALSYYNPNLSKQSYTFYSPGIGVHYRNFSLRVFHSFSLSNQSQDSLENHWTFETSYNTKIKGFSMFINGGYGISSLISHDLRKYYFNSKHFNGGLSFEFEIFKKWINVGLSIINSANFNFINDTTYFNKSLHSDTLKISQDYSLIYYLGFRPFYYCFKEKCKFGSYLFKNIYLSFGVGFTNQRAYLESKNTDEIRKTLNYQLTIRIPIILTSKERFSIIYIKSWSPYYLNPLESNGDVKLLKDNTLILHSVGFAFKLSK